MLPGWSLHDIVSARACAAADRIAVTAGDEQLSYGELDARAGRVADALRKRGVRPDTLVGLCAERGPQLIVGMLGILKAGGAYLPIDPAYPDERIRLLLTDSGVPLVVGDGPGLARVRGQGPDLVDCATASTGGGVDPAAGPALGAEAHPGAEAAPVRTEGHHLAYVIYTSGSTGRPKGVEIEHRNVVRLFGSTEQWFGFGPDDVWALFHSASFDFSVWEIWGALLYGGRLVIVPPTAARAPLELLDLLRRERVTVLNQTPSAFRLLVAADAALPRPADLALRWIVFGGERLDVGLLRPWIERHGDERPELINMYGITETTVHVTYRRIRAADLDRPDVSPVGVSIPDLRVTLHDAAGRAVPDGTPGEIWVGGAGVARGYRSRPELTAQRFGVGPDGERVYRSGDRAVRLPAGPGSGNAAGDREGAGEGASGELVHLGRIDDQLKVRGFRIEPFEVEVCVAAHPSVLATVVDAVDFGDGDVRLVAFVQPAAELAGDPARQRAAAAELREHVTGRLPAHLRPSEFRFVPEIPLTPQGKADRAAFRRTEAAAGAAVAG